MKVKAVEAVFHNDCTGCVFLNPDNPEICSIEDNSACGRLIRYCVEKDKIYKIKEGKKC